MTNTAGAERPTGRRSGRPKCAAVLGDGVTLCSRISKPGDTLCGPCCYREETGGDVVTPVLATWEPDQDDGGRNGDTAPDGVAPERFRAQLAEDLAEDYREVRDTLRDAMSNSSRRLQVSCPKCRTKVPVDVPDHGARIKAVQTWTELGLGRIRESNADEKKNGGQHRHAFSRQELENMTVDDLARLCAADDPLETTAENIAASATTNPDGTATVPADAWQAFLEARKEWGKVVATR